MFTNDWKCFSSFSHVWISLTNEIYNNDILFERDNGPRQEGPCTGVKCFLGLAGRLHGVFLGTLPSPTGPINFTPKAIGVCVAVWFDSFFKFKSDRYVKNVYDLGHHQYPEADV